MFNRAEARRGQGELPRATCGLFEVGMDGELERSVLGRSIKSGAPPLRINRRESALSLIRSALAQMQVNE